MRNSERKRDSLGRIVKIKIPPKKELQKLYSKKKFLELCVHYNVGVTLLWKWLSYHGIKNKKKISQPRLSLSPNWIGDNIGYQGAHRRVRIIRGTPNICEICKTKDPLKFYDWANITGNFKNIMDYKRMCRKCHRIFDHMGERLRGENSSKAKLTERKVLKIRNIYPKLSQDKLAIKFCVSRGAIQGVVERSTWKHI